MSKLPEILIHVLVGPPGKQRVRVSQTLPVLLTFVLFAFVQHVEVLFGLINAAASMRLTLFNLSGATLFYLLIRSGLNEKLPLEPSLTVPQMVFCLAALTWSYAITGPARGAIMSIMMLVLAYGIFALRPSDARRVALLGFGMLSFVMVYKALLADQRYDPHVELVHFAFAAIVTGGVAMLADRVGRRRTIVLLAWLTPLFCALGAAAPTFWILTASQTVARPFALALAMLATVATVEDMPRNSRAYALSLLAMAAGLGAGVAVAAPQPGAVADGGGGLGPRR